MSEQGPHRTPVLRTPASFPDQRANDEWTPGRRRTGGRTPGRRSETRGVGKESGRGSLTTTSDKSGERGAQGAPKSGAALEVALHQQYRCSGSPGTNRQLRPRGRDGVHYPDAVIPLRARVVSALLNNTAGLRAEKSGCIPEANQARRSFRRGVRPAPGGPRSPPSSVPALILPPPLFTPTLDPFLPLGSYGRARQLHSSLERLAKVLGLSIRAGRVDQSESKG